MANKEKAPAESPKGSSAAKRKYPRVQKKFTKPSMTKQEFKKECDLNHLLSRYQDMETLNAVAGRGMGAFGDFSEIGDFKTAQDQMKAAEEKFMDLPAKVRRRFNDNVGELLAFMANPKENIQEGIALGLFIDPKVLKAQEERKIAQQKDQKVDEKPEE